MDKKLENIIKLFNEGVSTIQSTEESTNPIAYARVAVVDGYLHGLARGCMELLTKEQIDLIRENFEQFSFYLPADGYFMPVANDEQFYISGE